MSRPKGPEGTGRDARNKKKKALETDKYKEDIEKLVARGVTAEDIQEIYDRCQERPQTKIARHTLTLKLVALLEYFDTRNEGIKEESKAYINKDDIIEMIMKNPRMITSSIDKNIIVKCEVITDKKDGDNRAANELIKSNPGIFRKTIDAIKEGR